MEQTDINETLYILCVWVWICVCLNVHASLCERRVCMPLCVHVRVHENEGSISVRIDILSLKGAVVTDLQFIVFFFLFSSHQEKG